MYTGLNTIPYSGPAIDLGANSSLMNDDMETILHPANPLAMPLSPFVVPAGPLAQADGDSGTTHGNTGLYLLAAVAAYLLLKK